MEAAPAPETSCQAPASTPSLKDLLEDGVYLLFLLRNGTPPRDAAEFNRRIDAFLARFERQADQAGKPLEAVHACTYAFCALLDEIVLNSEFDIRDAWERDPLQLRLFGEHLAGEGFFERLETLRLEPSRNLEAIEVFYTCLILGFRGKYLLEGEDRLGFYTARVGQEITSIRGGKPEFAPHWKLPTRFQAFVRREPPLWAFYALMAAAGILGFLVFAHLLRMEIGALDHAEPSTLVLRS